MSTELETETWIREHSEDVASLVHHYLNKDPRWGVLTDRAGIAAIRQSPLGLAAMIQCIAYLGYEIGHQHGSHQIGLPAPPPRPLEPEVA